MDTQVKALAMNEVTILQASIEVKVIKIGNRQVTLSVFRQLPEGMVIHQVDCQIMGVPWGRVNYHVDCEKAADHHFHVVFQRDGKLFRSIVESPLSDSHQHVNKIYSALTRDFNKAAASYLARCRLDGIIPGELIPSTDAIGRKNYICFPENSFVHFDYPYKLLIATEQELKNVLAGNSDDSRTLDELLEKVEQTNQECEFYMRRWLRSEDQLRKLDQLFIAV